MGSYMRAEDLIPDLVLCSTSVRTHETWGLVSGALGDDIVVEYDQALYGSSSGGLLASLHGADPDVARLLIIGHNPAIEALAHGLAGHGDRREIEALRLKYPTAALAVLETHVDAWPEVATGECTLERFVTPKDLPDAGSLSL
jgi:phosphohistidine phosphatase